MGKHVHFLSDHDEEARTGTCSNCGPVRIRKKQRGWRCAKAEDKWRDPDRNKGGSQIYRRFKKTYCERCGFTGSPCQLDVDHIDENHANNDEANLQTLCANCHRLKSHEARQQKARLSR